MLSFKKVGLEDTGLLRERFAAAPSRASDCTAGAVVMWRDFLSAHYALHGGSLLLRYRLREDGRTAFGMPLGGDAEEALKAIEGYCGDSPPLFCGVTEEDLPTLRARYPLRVSRDADWSDYLYRAEDLRELAGRRYDGQRNHINHFRRAYPAYRFEDTRPSDMEDLLAFYARSGRLDSKDSEYFREERDAVFEVLRNYEAYGFFGGVLRDAGEILAFSLGETVGDTLFVHIEKANPQRRGAYQAMVNEFAKRFAGPGVKYINREEDCGDEGLRRSKLSYHPCRLVEKYLVETLL